MPGAGAKRPRAEGMEFLRELLAAGPISVTQIEEETDGRRTSMGIGKARQEIAGRQVVQIRHGGWVALGIAEGLNPVEGAHPLEMSTFGQSEHLHAKTNGGSHSDWDKPHSSFLDRRNRDVRTEPLRTADNR